MKKFCLYSFIVLLVLGLIGCAPRSTSTGPENPTFVVVAENAEIAEVLAYFQAHSGYLPTVVTLNEETLASLSEQLKADGASAERADVLKKAAEGATCLVLKSDALIAEYEALGFRVDNEELKALTSSFRIDNADLLGLKIVQMPAGSELNLDALKALASWMTGAEAKYLADNPDLLK